MVASMRTAVPPAMQLDGLDAPTHWLPGISAGAGLAPLAAVQRGRIGSASTSRSTAALSAFSLPATLSSSFPLADFPEDMPPSTVQLSMGQELKKQTQLLEEGNALLRGLMQHLCGQGPGTAAEADTDTLPGSSSEAAAAQATEAAAPSTSVVPHVESDIDAQPQRLQRGRRAASATAGGGAASGSAAVAGASNAAGLQPYTRPRAMTEPPAPPPPKRRAGVAPTAGRPASVAAGSGSTSHPAASAAPKHGMKRAAVESTRAAASSEVSIPQDPMPTPVPWMCSRLYVARLQNGQPQALSLCAGGPQTTQASSHSHNSRAARGARRFLCPTVLVCLDERHFMCS